MATATKTKPARANGVGKTNGNIAVGHPVISPRVKSFLRDAKKNLIDGHILQRHLVGGPALPFFL